MLRVDRVQVNDSGLYECRASNQKQQTSAGFELNQGPDQVLRKVVRLVVNGKYSDAQLNSRSIVEELRKETIKVQVGSHWLDRSSGMREKQ